MKYDVNVKKVRSIQSNIWAQIKGTFRFRQGKDGEVNEDIIAHYGGVFKSGNQNLVIHTDGVGTKVLIAQQVNKYDTVGIDAIAMNANDIICLGAEPLIAVDYVAIAEEDAELMNELMKGLVKGCEESQCALVGGETAIMKDVIKGYDKPFDLAVTMVGKIRQNSKLITGKEIKPGDVILGIESSGIHSNGYTLARKALDVKEWGIQMLTPTRIYVKPILELLDNTSINVNGIAHITGGAFTKLRRLNKNVGFLLNELPEPLEIFKEIQKQVKDKNEMYKTFNMGIGMVVIIPKENEEETLKVLNKYYKTQRIGKIIEKDGVFLHSKSNPLVL